MHRRLGRYVALAIGKYTNYVQKTTQAKLGRYSKLGGLKRCRSLACTCMIGQVHFVVSYKMESHLHIVINALAIVHRYC